MRPVRLGGLSQQQLGERDRLYHPTRDVRVRTRAQMILLAAERGLVAAEIAAIVRRNEETVRRWLARYEAEGAAGLADAPRAGAPPKITPAYRERLLQIVRQRPRGLGLPFSLWVITRNRKRRREVAELLEALLAKHPHETVYVAWDNASTHEDEEVEAVLRGAAGRLVLLYLPTCSPWLNPIEMLRRHFRREVTHCELFDSVDALLRATAAFFDRCNRTPGRVRPIIGAHPA